MRLEPMTNGERKRRGERDEEKETRRKDSDDGGETSTSGVEAQAGKVGVGVVFLDLIDDEVTRRAISDVAVQPLGHA